MGRRVGQLARAKKENKLVYVDVYTTWCGPCKILARDVFPKKEAGDFYNRHFVNVRLDAEQGEGIGLAAKYNVEAYPTHLFINPANGDVVFRTSGAGSVADFVHHGEIAAQDHADPMRLARYQEQFAGKKQDTAYLKKYLEKLGRLEQNNDAVLDAYVATLPAGRLDTAHLSFLADNIQTIRTKAFDRLAAQQAEYEGISPKHPALFREKAYGWAYGSFELSWKTKDSSLALRAADLYRRYSRYEGEAAANRKLTEFWSAAGNAARAEQAGQAEMDYLVGRSDAVYDEADERALAASMYIFRAQARLVDGAPDSLVEKTVQNRIREDTSLRHLARSGAATRLNQIAWNCYEREGPNAAKARTQALPWAKRALELAAVSGEDWVQIADTYARLLYVNGRRAEAIRLMAAAVPKARALDEDTGKDYAETLAKMKAGTL